MAKNFVLLQVFYVILVRELETRLQQNQEVSSLDYDFLSNVAPSVQDVIENRSQQEILNWINANNPTASLLADTAIEGSGLNIISTNTTVGHDSFINEAFFKGSKKFPSPSKIGIGEVAFREIGFTNSSVSEDGSSKIDLLNKATLTESSIGKISPWHITSAKTTFIHTDIDEFTKAQVTVEKPTQIEVGVGEVGLLVNSFFNDFANPVNTPFPASKVFFSPSVLSNQFFSIHDSTPQIINDLNTIATNIWSDLLNPETPLNITFQVTDLPTGQLAEAQITSFDASGMPSAGTILIDDDANGKGWFIRPLARIWKSPLNPPTLGDFRSGSPQFWGVRGAKDCTQSTDSTPLDNSEFAFSNAANYFQADVNSAAYGKIK